MPKQIKLLTKLHLINFLQINEAKYGNDKKKKNRVKLITGTYIFLILWLWFYMGAISFGLASLGNADVIMPYLLTVTSAVVFFFSVFRSGNTIFNMQTYERLIALPLTKQSIIISRFLSMYLLDLVLSVVVMLPGIVVYIIVAAPQFWFYLLTPVLLLLVPMLPMSVACIIGALVYALSSRMKHKSIAVIVISLLLTLALLGGSLLMSVNSADMTDDEFIALVGNLSQTIANVYPPSQLFGAAVCNGDLLMFAAFVLLSLSVFALFVVLAYRFFLPICRSLQSHASVRGYKLNRLESVSPLKAIYKRELKRYFASSMYVLNTGIGCLMAVGASVALVAAGADTLFDALGEWRFVSLVPFVFSMMFILSPSTTSAISLEGNKWYLALTLPVPASTILLSKLLVNFTVTVPCWFISSVLVTVAYHSNFVSLLGIWLLPLAYIVFGAVMGLAVNLKMPMFQYESEMVVVKQSTTVLVAMLIAFFSVGIPVGIVMLAGEALSGATVLLVTVLLVVAAYLIWRKIRVVRLCTVGQ